MRGLFQPHGGVLSACAVVGVALAGCDAASETGEEAQVPDGLVAGAAGLGASEDSSMVTTTNAGGAAGKAAVQGAGAPPAAVVPTVPLIDFDLTEDADAGAPIACEGQGSCAGICCGADATCALGIQCVPAQGECSSNSDCQHDTFCDDGECFPYDVGGIPAYNDECEINPEPSTLRPVVQCRWTDPPEGDPFPEFNQVMATTMVADLDLDDDPATYNPSIVFPSFFTGGQGAVLRVISGDDCTEQLSFPENALYETAPVALADLTGDGAPEIVGVLSTGGLAAFGVSDDKSALEMLWRSGICDGSSREDDATGRATWAGPSIVDLDDDGVPEIVHGATVYDADGCVLSSSLGFVQYSQGIVPVLADVDEDGRVELVDGGLVYEWNANLSDWEEEPYAVESAQQGQVALAEIGAFPVATLDDEDFVEVAVVTSGQLRVQTLDGTTVFGPVPIPGSGVGGPPTIADFDGDGRREIASAGGEAYAVFDLDCVDGGGIGECNTARTDGILWSQPSNDRSSNVTGSSVFDFDGDGRAEVTYADQCFLRIYDGATGAVIASVGNTTNTAYENPVIADTDGDFRTELVVSANDFLPLSQLGCGTSDPLFESTLSQLVRGVTVFREASDQWAASRPIWNQHAYSVVNVTDDGVVPRTSQAELNWDVPGLNSFRQNSQGALRGLGLGDLTVRDGGSSCGSEPELRATICNRGTLPVRDGLEVAFLADDEELCRAEGSGVLEPGDCMTSTCSAGESLDISEVSVRVDPDNLQSECSENNNLGNTVLYACEQEAPPIR